MFQGLQGMEQGLYQLHIWPGAELDLSGRAVIVIESGELLATPSVDLDIYDAADVVRSVSEATVLVVNPPSPAASGAPGASASP